MEREENFCTWIENTDGLWESDCRHLFEFWAGGPGENGFVYCPYCGMILVEKSYSSEDV